MNEIKKCSIAGVSFTLEYDAYDALNAYIESLNDTYKDDPAGEEIIADIEARIAELILSAQPAGAIIARPLIENIIKQLGSASEIDEDHEHAEYQASTTDHNGNPRIPRRLYRDMQNRKLGGVCAGLANVVSVFGKILLIILKIFVVLLLIGMVLGTTVLGFVMLCSIPLFAFDFVTGLAFLCFILVIIIPLIVLIYLSIMLLVTHKPSGGFLLTALILWIVLLAGMTVSAIKSPVRLQEQIENAFESAFSNDEDKLYDAFSEEEIADFHKKIGEEYDPDAVEHSYDDTLSDDVKSKVTFTLNGHTVNVITKADRQLIFYGSKHDVNRCSESLLFDDGKTRFDISDDRTVIIEPNDEGSVKVTCDGESVECDTKVETNDAGATVTCSFSIDGVKVRYSCGPDVDSVDTTKEYVRDILGASSEIMDAAGEAMDAAGEAGKQATEAMQQAGEAMQQAGEAIQQAGEQIRKEIK